VEARLPIPVAPGTYSHQGDTFDFMNAPADVIVTNAVLAGNGTRLVTYSPDGVAPAPTLWDVSAQKVLGQLKSAPEARADLCYPGGGRYAVTVDSAGNRRIISAWNLADGRLLRSRAFDTRVSLNALSNDEAHVVVSDFDTRQMRLLEVPGLEETRDSAGRRWTGSLSPLSGPHVPGWPVSRAVLRGTDAEAHPWIWDLSVTEEPRAWPGLPEAANGIALNRGHGRAVLQVGATLELWQLNPVSRIQALTTLSFRDSVIFGVDGQSLGVVHAGTLTVFDLVSGRRLANLEPVSSEDLAFSCTAPEGPIYVWTHDGDMFRYSRQRFILGKSARGF
jgi:hypothetical protein